MTKDNKKKASPVSKSKSGSRSGSGSSSGSSSGSKNQFLCHRCNKNCKSARGLTQHYQSCLTDLDKSNKKK